MDFPPAYSGQSPDEESTGTLSGSFTQFMGFSSIFATLLSNSYLYDSVRLLVLGSVIEAGRRLCYWLMERFKFQYSISAQFDDGDPAYEWIVLFLTQENVWRKSRNFHVTAKSSKRKYGIDSGLDPQIEGNADYVPTYGPPHIFRWRGYWVEIKKEKGKETIVPYGMYSTNSLYLTMYTLDMSAISALVEEARLRYVEINRPSVIIHLADSANYGPIFEWNNIKSKFRRPLSSIILDDGVADSLLEDAREFLNMEDWYIEAGIPHRRGYLLYGPPGTGKTSTIYALAGELGLEIYSLSLASMFVDDSYLQRAASSIPKNSILLIEDIDCAFPSREDAEEDDLSSSYQFSGIGPLGYPGLLTGSMKSKVTLSGLLNTIDGVASEEGKLFFATTNYVDRLDPALLRPGRIDRKVQYKLATKLQASHLFTRFFPESRFGHLVADSTGEKHSAKTTNKKRYDLSTLAARFGAAIPEDEFSTAELQGFLLTCKMKPTEAVEGVQAWVEEERKDRLERAERERKRLQKLREAKAKRDAKQAGSAVNRDASRERGDAQGFPLVLASIGPTPNSAGEPSGVSPKTLINGITNGI